MENIIKILKDGYVSFSPPPMTEEEKKDLGEVLDMLAPEETHVLSNGAEV
tara:strand:- start:6909 stop:7058 length:150 start_codon:yes stop_codon:yes gene_type:complete